MPKEYIDKSSEERAFQQSMLHASSWLLNEAICFLIERSKDFIDIFKPINMIKLLLITISILLYHLE
jgi:hypothetical protein